LSICIAGVLCDRIGQFSRIRTAAAASSSKQQQHSSFRL
jgi:hypothetical protein